MHSAVQPCKLRRRESEHYTMHALMLYSTYFLVHLIGHHELYSIFCSQWAVSGISVSANMANGYVLYVHTVLSKSLRQFKNALLKTVCPGRSVLYPI